MEKKLWQKVATAALAVALAVVPAVGLVGCGGNPADQVKSVVTSNFDQIKSLDAEAIDELGSMDELKELETTYGISSERLIKAFYGHFDYTVDSVEVDGDTATVKITSSNVDLQKVVESYMDSLTEFATSGEAQNLVTEGGQQAVQDKVVELLMAAFEAEDVPIATGQTDLAMERADNSWTYVNEGEVLQVLFGGQDLQSAMSQYS